MEFVNFQVCDFLGFVFLGLKYHYLGHICRYTEVIEITVYAAGVDYCPVVCSDDLNTGLRPAKYFFAASMLWILSSFGTSWLQTIDNE